MSCIKTYADCIYTASRLTPPCPSLSAVEADSGASADKPSTPSSRARRHLLASGAVLHASASERSSSIAEGAEEVGGLGGRLRV